MNFEKEQLKVKEDIVPLTMDMTREQILEAENGQLRLELLSTKQQLAQKERLIERYRAITAFLLADKPLPVIFSKMLRFPGSKRMTEEMAEIVAKRLDCVLKDHFDNSSLNS